MFMGTALDQTTVGAAGTDMDLKFIKDICVTTISIFGMLITVFISASAIPNEVENKVIYTVLTKPVRRPQYLLGKFAGIQLIIIANLALMGGLFFIALYLKQGIMPTLLLWSILLTYLEFLIVSAFTFAISCTSTSAVLPTIGGLFIYLTGNLTEYLKDVELNSGGSGEAMDVIISKIAMLLRYVLPNLQDFSLKSQIINSLPNDPVGEALTVQLIIYALIYAVTGWLIGYLIFFRKEL